MTIKKFNPQTRTDVSAMKAELAQSIDKINLKLAPVKNGSLVKFEFKITGDIPIVMFETKCPCFEHIALYDDGFLLKGTFDATASNFSKTLWRDGNKYYEVGNKPGNVKVLIPYPEGGQVIFEETEKMEEVLVALLDKKIILHPAQTQKMYMVDENRELKSNPLYITQSVRILGYALQEKVKK